ncbi:L domain-like protein [Aureobasidium pullulans]|nr:L domain-like protein [Aureobasidium pullulans]
MDAIPARKSLAVSIAVELCLDAFHLKKLTRLVLSKQQERLESIITVLPSSLEYLDLEWNQLSSLAGISFPPNLTHLNVLSFEGLSHLEHLEHMHLGAFDCIFNLDSLRTHNLPRNPRTLSLTSIGLSPEILRMIALPASLEELELRNCQVSSLRDLVLPDGLKKLGLWSNKIEDLEGYIFPDNLLALDIGYNLIRTLRDIRWPSGLETLRLDVRNLISLKDSSLCDLTRLKDLSLSCRPEFLVAANLPRNLRKLTLNEHMWKEKSSRKFAKQWPPTLECVCFGPFREYTSKESLLGEWKIEDDMNQEEAFTPTVLSTIEE